jgi:hypothetical protein
MLAHAACKGYEVRLLDFKKMTCIMHACHALMGIGAAMRQRAGAE